MPKYKVGIAGYMGSGKTTCSRFFENAGAVLINADLEAKKMMQNEEAIQQALLQEFGNSIFENGTLSFKHLGSIVFDSIECLKKLNSIVHPPLIRHLHQLMLNYRNEIVVLDAALIPLWNIDSWFDLKIWVDASEQVRLERIAKKVLDTDNEQIRKRIIAQETLFPVPSTQTWKYIFNEDSIEMLRQKVFSIVAKMITPHSSTN